MLNSETKCPRCGKGAVGQPVLQESIAAAPEPVREIPHWERADFNPGGIEDTPDDRDYRWEEVGASSAPFNWDQGYDIETALSVKLNRPGFTLTSNDQNGSGSCGGQAFSKYDAVQRAMFAGDFNERSAKYLYSQVFVPGGGSAARPIGDVLVSQGCSSETLCPSYDNGQPPSEAFMERLADLTPDARADAPHAQSRSYAVVPIDIDSIAQAIRDCYGVVLGLYGSNNGTWGSAFPQPPVAGLQPPARWAHWMYFGKAKIVNGQKAVGGLQSWGPGIGQNGWQFLDQNYVQNAVWGAWTLVFNPSSIPPSFSHDFETDLAFGMQSSEVVALQTALQIDGEFPPSVPTTGFYGTITAKAVYAFQTKYSVAPANELNALAGKKVGPATRAKLNQIFNK